MTGLPRWRARSTSRQIVSEATAEPPGLLMRNRMARTSLVAEGLAKRAADLAGAHLLVAEQAAGAAARGIMPVP